jgi:hypothetical protein
MILNEQLDRRGAPKGVSWPFSYYVFRALLKEAKGRHLRSFEACPFETDKKYIRVIKKGRGNGWSVAVGLYPAKWRTNKRALEAKFKAIVRVAWSPHEAMNFRLSRFTYDGSDAMDERDWIDTCNVRVAVQAVVNTLLKS